MAKVTTLARMWWPLMDGPSIDGPRCAVCGASWPLNRHHVVKRSAGKLYRNGVEVPKPTIILCGSGNASGCHGKAHQGRLHFRYVKDEWPSAWVYARDRFDSEPHRGGHWEYLETDEPCKYLEALGMDGWRRLKFGE